MATSALSALSTLICPNSKATTIFWTDEAIGISRLHLESGISDLVVAGTNFTSISLDPVGGKLYWTQTRDNIIQRSNLDGSNVESIPITGVHYRWDLEVDSPNGKIYWTGNLNPNNPERIGRSNLDGSAVETLVPGPGRAYGLDLDHAAGKMYWTDIVNDSIYRANFDGSSIESLVSGIPQPIGLALATASGKMYWSDHVSDVIQRSNLDGSHIETIASGLPAVHSLEIFDGKLYWTEHDLKKIQRSNMDGSGIETLVTGLVNPSGIAIMQDRTPSVPEAGSGFALLSFALGSLFCFAHLKRSQLWSAFIQQNSHRPDRKAIAY